MSKSAFQAKVTLNSATSTSADNTMWECQLTFTDNDGAYSGTDIAVGDVVVFDTSAVETGTLTLYGVSAIVTSSPTQPVLSLHYLTVNDNAFGPPDLSWLVGQDGTVARPSAKLGLLPVVSRDLQLISDKFTEYVQNYNFVKIVDSLPSGDRTFAKINGDVTPLLKGMAVYITLANGAQVKRGSATSSETSHVVGLIADAVVPTNALGEISSKGMLEKTTNDWDIITGEQGGLKAGRDYFLRTDSVGGITSTPPFGDGLYVVKVGKAVSSTVIDINIEPPIGL